jgi:enamine deaminase RidA (YjgF/YER057c/UK114 family)
MSSRPSPELEPIERKAAIAGLPEPTGPYVWSARLGGLLFVSGLRGIDPESGRPAESDERRLQLIFDHLDRVLESNGCTRANVLSTRVYVTSMAGLRPLVNAAYRTYFGDALPTRTIVEVSALNQDDSVEIEVVAARAGPPASLPP